MSTFIGADLGSTLVKTSKMVCFPSGVTQDNMELRGGHKVVLDGEQYITGLYEETAALNPEVNKKFNKYILLNFYTALALSMPKNDNYGVFKAVVGYPIEQYSANKVEFREMLTSRREGINIIVDTHPKTIVILDADVYPEGAGAFFTPQLVTEEPTLVVDVGGLTVNWAFFTGKKLLNYGSPKMGMMLLYQQLARELNRLQDIGDGTAFTLHSIYSQLTDGYWHKGVQVNLAPYVEKNIDKHFRNILDHIGLQVNIGKVRNVFFIGGCMDHMSQYLENLLPDYRNVRILKDSKYMNAQGFEEMAKLRFKE